jgi:hypothetical protein
MYYNWGDYTKPLHLNNTTGKPTINGNISLPTKTPFVVLSEANGNSYVPTSTQFMDVYSGGAPYTLTQELVQRGAEIQEDTLRVAVSASTFELAAQLVDTLRHALTEQEATGPQILKIKRSGQTSYTEWLVTGAKIQEDQSYFARDALDSAYPTIYLAIKIARSPYGSESNAYLTFDTATAQIYCGEVFAVGNTSIKIADYPMLYNSFVNIDFQYNFFAATTGIVNFGPLVFSLVDDDTFYTSDAGGAGTIAAGSVATVGTYYYTIRNSQDLTAPICIGIMATVDSNEIEMRATINGNSTPYVRSVGTHINSTNATNRFFSLPSFDVQKIFAGVPDYDMTTIIPITIEARNINRGTSRNYTAGRVNIWRSNNVMQLFPTTNWSSRADPYPYYRVISFYDQLEFPAQPLPNVKAIITSASKSRYSYIPLQNIAMTFQEAAEIRGTQLRITQKTGIIQLVAFWMNYNGSMLYPTRPTFALDVMYRIRVGFAPIYQNIKGNL